MTEHEQDTILFYAFRYALGRTSYCVNGVVELIIKHNNILSTNHRGLMIKEIQNAIANNQAGWECDVKEWEKLLVELYK